MKFKRQEGQQVSVEARQEGGGQELVGVVPHEWPEGLPILDVDSIPVKHEDPWPKEIREMLEEVTGKNKDTRGDS